MSNPFKFAIGRPSFLPATSGNLVSNSGAESDATGWTLFDTDNMALVRHASAAYRGTAGFILTCNTDAGDGRVRPTTTLATVFGKGVSYRARCWVKAPTGNPAIGKDCGLAIAFFSEDELTMHSPGPARASVTLTDQWQEINVQFSCTVAGMTKVRPLVGIDTPTAGDIVWFDQVEMYRVDDEDGAGDFLVPSVVERIGVETDATNHPATNVMVERLSRTWRSTADAANCTLSFWMGPTAVLPAAVFVEGANVAAVTIESADSWNGAAVYSGTFTIPKSDVTDRYSGLCVIPGGTAAARYWRVKIASTTPPIPTFAGYYELARVTWVQTLHSMDQNWGVPYGPQPASTGGHAEGADANLDSVDISDLYAVIALTGSFSENYGDNIIAQLRRMQRMRHVDRKLFFENGTDISRCWLCAKVGDMTVQKQTFPKVQADLVLREAV